jgi:hypothetical protein
MPIKWSAVAVSDKVDEMEKLYNSITPTLWQVLEKAEELRRIPNLPGYIDQPAHSLVLKIQNFNHSMKSSCQCIRDRVPPDALKEQRKVLEYGSVQPLM